MTWRLSFASILAIGCVVVLAQWGRGDTVKLKDGTVLQGTVIEVSGGYWFKGEDGQRRRLSSDEVVSVERGAGSAAGHDSPISGGHFVGSFSSVKRRAEAVDTPVAAVSIWQQYIDSKPSAAELKLAQEEMVRWKKLQQDGAERIKGKWVGGEERKMILEKARQLHNEAISLMRNHQTLAAIKKLEESQAVYPNSFDSAFWLGYLSMLKTEAEINKATVDKAINYFNQALRIRPHSPEALANLGLCQLEKREFQQAVLTLYRAAEAGDNAEIAQDLVTALSALPPIQRQSDRIRPAVEAAGLLASRYHVSPGNLVLVPLRENKSGGSDNRQDVARGGYYSGSGFLITPDGLILTNRHVVEGSKTLMVLLEGKVQKSAEIVNIDDEQDLALIRVKGDHPLPFVRFSRNDSPADGADCTVMGFPLIDRLGASIKVTRGIVSSKADQEIGADVMIDAKVNPGNSGGPILDRYGNVMAIISMKSRATELEDSYGFGISAGRIRHYLEKNHVALPPGVASTTVLNTEQVVAKAEPAAVCILSTR